jgi:hypothetical protein
MRVPRSVRSFVVLAILFLLARPAASTQVEYRSIEALGAESALVVRGEVSAVRSYWNQSGSRIYTEVTVEVTDDFKGAAPREVRVVQMGGVVDGVRMTVAGALAWQPGESVVLFLEDSLPGRYRVSGFSQGKFDVERDERTGAEYVRQTGLGGVELVGAAARRGSTNARIPLADLLRRALPGIQFEGEE